MISNQSLIADYLRKCRESNGDDAPDSYNPNDIAPYSEYNLMSTNIWNDEAYDRFVETLTQAEKMVLTLVFFERYST